MDRCISISADSGFFPGEPPEECETGHSRSLARVFDTNGKGGEDSFGVADGYFDGNTVSFKNSFWNLNRKGNMLQAVSSHNTGNDEHGNHCCENDEQQVVRRIHRGKRQKNNHQKMQDTRTCDGERQRKKSIGGFSVHTD